MSDYDEDDKPTVVLDLNALRKQQLKADEELANIASELEFNVDHTTTPGPVKAAPLKPEALKYKVILFDLEGDFLKKSKSQFPAGYDYQVCSTLPELNIHLREKTFHIVVFNYDQNPKAINQLSTQIKLKFPMSKVLIMAKNISPKKAQDHALTPAGASGYYQLPLEPKKIEEEFIRIHKESKKIG